MALANALLLAVLPVLIPSMSLSRVFVAAYCVCDSGRTLSEVHPGGTELREQCGIVEAQNNYLKVMEPTLSAVHLEDLPGFTRSVYERDHALITPESHVFSPLPGWTNTLGAYLATPAIGAHFNMYFAKMGGNSSSAQPLDNVERFIFVVEGVIQLHTGEFKGPVIHHIGMVQIIGRHGNSPWNDEGFTVTGSGTGNSQLADLTAGCAKRNPWVDGFAFLPAHVSHVIQSDESSTLVVFERRYSRAGDEQPELIVGYTDKQPLLETPGEVFALRKLLPAGPAYDFNIHVMDFQPGEYLYVKEVHYNQHGLILLEGRGIYRLGKNWYPVQAGDAIWMAPFVPQWYAALGRTRSRYLLYKDGNRDPLLHPY